jgi:hypothetical protein
MSKLRKIYKGEENWDCIYTEQDEILKGTTIPKKVVDENKSYTEDYPGVVSPGKAKNNISSMTNKFDNVAINHATIDNDNIITEEDRNFEVNEDDYANFDYNYDIDFDNDNNDKKRSYNDAFGMDVSEPEKKAKFK